MALSKSLRNLAEKKAEMDMTPMIDVTFLLLIFFMCTLHFKAIEGILQSYLPKDQGRFDTAQERKPQEPVKVKLLKTTSGTILWLGDRKLVGESKFDQLAQQLRTIISRTPDVPVVIDPDIDIPFQDIISTLNACRRVDRELGGDPIKIQFTTKIAEQQQ